MEIHVTNKGDRAGWPATLRNLMSTWPDLVDAKDRKYDRVDASGNGGSEFFLNVHYRNLPENAAELGDPQKLIWKISPTGRVLTIPFEFKDVPLEKE